MDEETAGIMLTNPNTLGLFEAHIREIAAIVHAKGGAGLRRRGQSQRCDGHRGHGRHRRGRDSPQLARVRFLP
jgi:hypothetical protein